MGRFGFPGVKLILQIFRQFTKPLSNSIINFAKRRPSFRQHFLITPGRYYYGWHTMIKTYLRTNKFDNIRTDFKIARIKKIDESRAMEIGAQLMLEALIFLILATFVVYESSKAAARSQLLEETRELDFAAIVGRKNDLSRRLEDQAALIQELRLRIRSYSTELGYSLPRLSETLEDEDFPSPNSDDST